MNNPGQCPIIILGDSAPGGAYVLRLHVRSSIQVVFGRFKNGEPITVVSGDWLYVGSAMSQQGAATLARRLIRHASRAGDSPPHALRPALIAALGDGSLAPRQKTLRWHVDYLLQRPEVELTHVIAIRSSTRLEATLAAMAAEHAQIVAPGLGASDAPGQTHLLYLPGSESAWNALANRLVLGLGASANEFTD